MSALLFLGISGHSVNLGSYVSDHLPLSAHHEKVRGLPVWRGGKPDLHRSLPRQRADLRKSKLLKFLFLVVATIVPCSRLKVVNVFEHLL